MHVHWRCDLSTTKSALLSLYLIRYLWEWVILTMKRYMRDELSACHVCTLQCFVSPLCPAICTASATATTTATWLACSNHNATPWLHLGHIFPLCKTSFISCQPSTTLKMSVNSKRCGPIYSRLLTVDNYKVPCWSPPSTATRTCNPFMWSRNQFPTSQFSKATLPTWMHLYPILPWRPHLHPHRKINHHHPTCEVVHASDNPMIYYSYVA